MNRRTLPLALLAASLGLFAAASARAADAPEAGGKGFSFADTPGEHLDVLLDGKIVARYMDAHDTSTPARRLETYKPYLHVFDAEGKEPITKGAGGNFTHHRGIFIGWMKITSGGKTYDRWHMVNGDKAEKAGDIVHQKFLEQKAGPDEATFTSLTHWEKTAGGEPLVEEERTMTFHRGPAPFRLTIDFSSKIKAADGDLTLGGDPEHAGIHFRPADDITSNQTIYVYPVADPQPHKDVDYPWVGETYTLHGQRHSVVEMSHPDDPKQTRWSAYRDYGRFGAFPTAAIKGGESRTFKYRFLIADGEMPPTDVIEKSYDQFTGTKEPSAVPKATVKPAEYGAGPKPKTTKPAEPKKEPKEPAAAK